MTGSVAALVALYHLLPLDHSSAPVAVTMLVIGLVGFIALVADLIVFGLTIKVIVGAVRRGRQRRMSDR